MISAVVLTKNEEKNIEKCLKDLSFCSEIVVVDDNSSDDTRKIAQSLGAKVFIRDMQMDFSAQSNFGMDKAKGDWVLFVDADERVNKDLSDEIISAVAKPTSFSGFFIKRKDFIWGKLLNYGESGNQKLLRFVKKGHGLWKRRVHPFFEITGTTSTLESPLLHYPHQNISEFILSLDRWSTWHALANKEEGKISSLLKISLWPPCHFIKNYFFKLGFLDGIEGFIFAVIMSFHSFLSWSKLIILQKQKN